MKQTTSLFCITLLALLVGCVKSDAPPDGSESHSSHSDYGDKISGIYGLYVDTEKMKQELKPSTPACKITTYPVDERNTFTQSVHGIFENLFEEIRKVDTPVPAADLQEQGLDGMIKIEVENLEVGMIITPTFPTFWRGSFSEEAKITTNIQVTEQNGDVLESIMEASDGYEMFGFVCEGLRSKIGKSVKDVTEKTVEYLGTHITSFKKSRDANSKN